MPVPNTGGQLRSKIADMQVGDYIPYRWLDSKYNFEVGTIGTTEVPVTGTAWLSNWNNYYGYMIKVDKGLLVSDRVFAHSGSWDAINSRKWIQGYAMDNGNIIPTMTSNTAPSGVASASSEFSSNTAFKAMDQNDSTFWQSLNGQTGPHWLCYTFDKPKVIKKVNMRNASVNTSYRFLNFSIEASNDTTDGVNGTWTTLASGLNMTNDTNLNSFTLSNSTPFSSYRISGATTTYIRLASLELCEGGIIRSLGGGCAYADANGNPVTTDQGLGAAPTDNEYDQFIVKKDYGTGAGRDDVWHWNIGTWCQETAMLNMPWGTGTVDNTYRMARGRLRNNLVDYKAGTATSPAQGFRPVFQYDEVTP